MFDLLTYPATRPPGLLLGSRDKSISQTRPLRAVLGALLLLAGSGCGAPASRHEVRSSGEALGTTWSVKWVSRSAPQPGRRDELHVLHQRSGIRRRWPGRGLDCDPEVPDHFPAELGGEVRVFAVRRGDAVDRLGVELHGDRHAVRVRRDAQARDAHGRQLAVSEAAIPGKAQLGSARSSAQRASLGGGCDSLQ